MKFTLQIFPSGTDKIVALTTRYRLQQTHLLLSEFPIRPILILLNVSFSSGTSQKYIVCGWADITLIPLLYKKIVNERKHCFDGTENKQFYRSTYLTTCMQIMYCCEGTNKSLQCGRSRSSVHDIVRSERILFESHMTDRVYRHVFKVGVAI